MSFLWPAKKSDRTDAERNEDRYHEERNPALAVVGGRIIPKIEGIGGEIVRTTDHGRDNQSEQGVTVAGRDDEQRKTR